MHTIVFEEVSGRLRGAYVVYVHQFQIIRRKYVPRRQSACNVDANRESSDILLDFRLGCSRQRKLRKDLVASVPMRPKPLMATLFGAIVFQSTTCRLWATCITTEKEDSCDSLWHLGVHVTATLSAICTEFRSSVQRRGHGRPSGSRADRMRREQRGLSKATVVLRL